MAYPFIRRIGHLLGKGLHIVSGQDRSCQGCGLPLSRYNTGSSCQSCMSAGRQQQPAQPGELLIDGGKLAELRRKRSMTQHVLADRAGISFSLLEKLERNARRSTSLASLNALARALNIPLHALLEGPPGTPASGATMRSGTQPAQPLPHPASAGPDSPAPAPAPGTTIIQKWTGREARALREAMRMGLRDFAAHTGIAERSISKWEAGSTAHNPRPGTQAILDTTLKNAPQEARTRFEAALGTGAIPAAAADPDPGKPHILGLLSPGPGEGQEGQDAVRRRTFVELTGASMISALLAEPASGRAPADTEPLASVLTGSAASTVGADPGPPADIAILTAEMANVRRQYQACRYTELASQLPGLLAQLHSACLTLTGDAQDKAFALSADAHHVAAGLLLKLDDQGLAYLAADRSMRAAQASEDPVTIGASARIITHTLMDGGHLSAAVSTASGYAARLDHDIGSHTPESLSVYGALVLRGAIAAAQDGKRGTARELLNEADQAAQRLGADADGNLRGTAFGPANVVVHRVNVAVTLGDAGTAIDTARGVDLTKIAVTERKATLLIDVARAYLQWGRHEKAYLALRAAEATAHEEVSGRPSVHRLVRDLLTTAPPGIRGEARQFAEQIGVSR
jgi:transcriptional regulator with XRE-family HTH domain